MKNLRERCQNWLDDQVACDGSLTDQLEDFAREIRNEALAEAKTAIFKSEIPCIECSEIAENSVRALIRTTALAAVVNSNLIEQRGN